MDYSGPLFRAVRQRRRLTIEQVRGNYSQPNVSNYERGNRDLYLSTLKQLLPNTLMSFGEFMTLYEGNNDPFQQQLNRAGQAFSQHDIAGLSQQVAELQAVSRQSAPAYLVRLMLEILLQNAKTGIASLSAEDEEFVVGYLLESDVWYGFEYLIAANLIDAMSYPNALKVLRHMKRALEQKTLPTYQRGAETTIYNFCAHLADFQQWDSVATLITTLSVENWPLTDNMALYLKYHLAFLSAMLAVRNQDPDGQTKVDQLLAAASLVDQGLADKLTDWWQTSGLGDLANDD